MTTRCLMSVEGSTLAVSPAQHFHIRFIISVIQLCLFFQVTDFFMTGVFRPIRFNNEKRLIINRSVRISLDEHFNFLRFFDLINALIKLVNSQYFIILFI